MNISHFMVRFYLVLLVLFNFVSANIAFAADKPQIQLAKQYQDKQHAVSDYLISEKLDGVRGYWDGKQLLTRAGKVINVPKWFSEDFPNVALEGELWLGRGQFEAISALVRRQQADDNQWQKVRFMLFDLPLSNASFESRYIELQHYAQSSIYLTAISQISLDTEQALYLLLDNVIEKGGEGLMLHYKLAKYHIGRSSNIVKLKPKYDAEALVIGYQQGKGKYRGQLGALVVKMPDGKQFEIGSGFSDDQRRNPPPIGSTISYYYLGLTKNGIPRFASFWRVREDEPE
ncbi:DNA ligase [Shewanella aestuarii]|uniref:DNA ligase n=1 Tax=Shewanella aestuarii TaxID=1028752 RepID=A0A6G9QL65_9GAMM|nr:DNA ligase [Shewanella aestuarii]QIR14805.1 DNA ligase [Shewanella aestuarii]